MNETGADLIGAVGAAHLELLILLVLFFVLLLRTGIGVQEVPTSRFEEAWNIGNRSKKLPKAIEPDQTEVTYS